MPMYRTKQDELDAEILRLEYIGEVITQVLTDPETLDGYIILTSKSVNDTGRPHVPSWDRETRS
jgi:hypothetical protein